MLLMLTDVGGATLSTVRPVYTVPDVVTVGASISTEVSAPVMK
jgi:hypothetical protein